jgi:ribosome-binding factor A
MPREFSRVDRIEGAIHRALAELLSREVADRRLAHLTISRVRVSRDLAHAKVYVTGFPDAAEGEASWQALRHATGFLRSGLAHRLLMRTVPELRFVRDTSLVEGNRLAALIEGAAAAPAQEGGEGIDE